jgi:hypothetical protein
LPIPAQQTSRVYLPADNIETNSRNFGLIWLILKTELQFGEMARPIFPHSYNPDLQPEGSELYYGAHFIQSPPQITSGEKLVAMLVVRAFPKDPCVEFQTGKRFFVKNGPLTRAEGTVLSRHEQESPSTTIRELQQELEQAKFESQ